MPLVAAGLKARGVEVGLPSEDSGQLSIRRGAGRCRLSVSDCGRVEWECALPGRGQSDPKRMADVATVLLTGRGVNHPRRGDGYGRSGISLKGVVALELKARGFDVDLEVFADDVMYDVFGGIVVTDPGTGTNASVHIGDDGFILWEHDYLAETADTDPGILADTIAATVTEAVSLSLTPATE